MAQDSDKKDNTGSKKTHTAIKLAPQNPSERTSGGRPDPGPGDLAAQPSSMPVDVELPSPPTDSQLITKSIPGSIPDAVISELPEITETKQMTSGSKMLKSGSHKSGSNQATSSEAASGGGVSQMIAEDSAKKRPHSGSHKSGAASQAAISAMGSAHSGSHKSGAGSTQAPASGSLLTHSPHKSGSNTHIASSGGSHKSGSQVPSSSQGPVSEAPPSERAASGQSAATTSHLSGSGVQALKSGSHHSGSHKSGSQLVSEGPGTQKSGGVGTSSPMPSPSGVSSKEDSNHELSTFASTGSSRKGATKSGKSGSKKSNSQKSGTQRMSPGSTIPTIIMDNKKEPKSKTSSEDNSDLLKSMSPAGGHLTTSTVVGKDGKKKTKYHYHRRITVHTKGKTSPASVLSKVNKKEHDAGITISTIDQLDPAEIMKRAGLKPSPKTHWRVRLRETEKIHKDGKTTTQTKLAYRDSEGNKNVRTVNDNETYCAKCGEKTSDCKCSKKQ